MAKAPYLPIAFEKPALGAIDKSRVIAVINNQAVYADNTNVAHRNNVRGISVLSVGNGQDQCIQTTGPYADAAWSWTADQPLYLTTVGNLTQTKPTTGDIVVFGQAISTTEIFVDIHRFVEQKQDHVHVKETFTLTGTDISNKYVTVGQTPVAGEAVEARPQGGLPGVYDVDFKLHDSVAKRLTWEALGWDGRLSAGEKLVVRYYRSAV